MDNRVDTMIESEDQLSALSPSQKEELIRIYMEYKVYYDYCTYTPNNTYLADPELPSYHVDEFLRMLNQSLELPKDIPLTIRFRSIVSDGFVIPRIDYKRTELDGAQFRKTNR
jgi:hypothetical protein